MLWVLGERCKKHAAYSNIYHRLGSLVSLFVNIGLVEKPRSRELFWDEVPCLPLTQEINCLKKKNLVP